MVGPTKGVESVALSPDGKRIISAGGDGFLRLWNAETGEEILAFLGHVGRVTDVVYSNDGTRIASAGWDHMLRIWEAESPTGELPNSR